LPDLTAERHAAGQPAEAGQTSQHGGLAAAGRPDQRGDALRGDVDLDVEIERPDPPAQARLVAIAGGGRHGCSLSRPRPTSSMVSTTAKANTSMPAAIRCA